jgi:pyruvate formate-lyase/glycerol dehydratase family glycyl radical enzyme
MDRILTGPPARVNARRYNGKPGAAVPALEAPLAHAPALSHAWTAPVSARVQRLRAEVLATPPSICPERALLITRAYRETAGQPMVVRRAHALQTILAGMPILLEDGQLIAGNQAGRVRAAPVFPEYSIDWVIDELEHFDRRPGDAFEITPAARLALRGIHADWHGRTHQDQVRSSLSDDNRRAEAQNVIHRGGISMSGDGHIIPDHATILARGYRSLIAEAGQRRRALDPADPATPARAAFYRASATALQAALDFADRFSALARRQAAQAPEAQRRRELRLLAEVCARAPAEPAASFHEALQTVYFTHLVMMIESNGHSFSFGRFDQYMLPYYARDLAAGVLTREQALELLALFFIKLNTLNKVRPWDHTEFGVGHPLYSNLMVGGSLPGGGDGTNDLTDLCIEAIAQARLPEPNFSVRIGPGSPRALLEASARLIRQGFGMPSLFFDETVIPALQSLGLETAVARDYASMGCVEVAIPGRWTHRATGMTYINLAKIFELVLNNGLDPRSGIQLVALNGRPGRAADYGNYEELFEAWRRLLKLYTDLAVESDAVCDRSLKEHDADPFASSMVSRCLEAGKTLKQGGAEYDFVSHSTVGPNTVADSLAAVKKLVFDDRAVSLAELRHALDANWQGEGYRRLRRLARAAPTFGNDDEQADAIAASVYESYLDLLPAYRTDRHGQGPFGCGYTMSTSNISSNVPYGMDVGATPDGRGAGEPLNEGASPCRGADRLGPTAVARSMARLPNRRMAGGQLLNMKLTPALLEGNEALDKFVAFLEAFPRLGLFHVQFNVVDRATLLDARQHPERYPDLMVRVAGYCALFTSLMPEVQDDIIQRTEHASF